MMEDVKGPLLEMFTDAGIKVIRLGLHSGGNVEDGYVAGAYHPALRELCESRIYLEKIKNYIENEKITGKIMIYVCLSHRHILHALGIQKRFQLPPHGGEGARLDLRDAILV